MSCVVILSRKSPGIESCAFPHQLYKTCCSRETLVGGTQAQHVFSPRSCVFVFGFISNSTLSSTENKIQTRWIKTVSGHCCWDWTNTTPFIYLFYFLLFPASLPWFICSIVLLKCHVQLTHHANVIALYVKIHWNTDWKETHKRKIAPIVVLWLFYSCSHIT